MYLPSIFIDPIRNKLIELSFALRKIYYQTKGYHQSAERLLSDAEKEGYDFSLPDVKNWLHRQAIWQIHSPSSKYILQVSFNGITRPNEYCYSQFFGLLWD